MSKQLFSVSFQFLYALLLASLAIQSLAFPSYESLGGLSERQLKEIIPTLDARVPPSPPGPLRFNGTKLVDDSDHPFRAPGPGDVRGPCPGLNTLANHGYLPRNGVATPAQMIQAAQDGFNMDNQPAHIAAYAAHLMNGNLVTDLLSIGGKTRNTGSDPRGQPAPIAGISEHGTFEGDASLTRGDDFFGDNHSFNQTLFDQFVEYSNRFGGGFYNYSVAAELRFQRIQQSIATNPEFDLRGFRHFTAFGETVFAVNMFTDGRKTGAEAGQLDLKSARSFFRDGRYPRGFHRANKPTAGEGVEIVLAAHPVAPGHNVGVNNYVEDRSRGSMTDFCTFYKFFINTQMKEMYPNPTGVLRRNLNLNLDFFYQSIPFLYDSFSPPDCPQIFPYGRN
ncbi:Cloroperoxidase [Coprinopsis marcescibilis]|uniref:Cloroperoxidase n=1 Tax=Coprinopsis marcescibilis TaxID=230819 RepID=A0A5C3KLB0_COPMA|nr:Cloroperoxidase [Coprinopsis marcescibilis]